MSTFLLSLASSYLIVCSVYSVDCVSKWDQFMGQIDNFGDPFGGTACLPAVARKSSKCVARFHNKMDSRPDGENDIKYMCCEFVSLSECVRGHAEHVCGKHHKKLQSILSGIMDHIDLIVSQKDCANYNRFSCLTLFQILALFGVAVALIFLIALSFCLCCYCCKYCRKRRNRKKKLSIIEEKTNEALLL